MLKAVGVGFFKDLGTLTGQGNEMRARKDCFGMLLAILGGYSRRQGIRAQQ